MNKEIIENPNSITSKIMDDLKNIENQRKKYAKYDSEVQNFKIDESNKENIEEFFIFKDFMYGKILILLIICILALFIIKFIF
jgi:hypothetical protein